MHAYDSKLIVCPFNTTPNTRVPSLYLPFQLASAALNTLEQLLQQQHRVHDTQAQTATNAAIKRITARDNLYLHLACKVGEAIQGIVFSLIKQLIQ